MKELKNISFDQITYYEREWYNSNDSFWSPSVGQSIYWGTNSSGQYYLGKFEIDQAAFQGLEIPYDLGLEIDVKSSNRYCGAGYLRAYISQVNYTKVTDIIPNAPATSTQISDEFKANVLDVCRIAGFEYDSNATGKTWTFEVDKNSGFPGLINIDTSKKLYIYIVDNAFWTAQPGATTTKFSEEYIKIRLALIFKDERKAYISIPGSPLIQNPPPLSSLDYWKSNQNVTLSINGSSLKVRSNQNSSAPGVYTELTEKLAANLVGLKYKIRGNVKVGGSLWSVDGSSINEINYNDLSETDFKEFIIYADAATKIHALYFFMTNPLNGSWFELEEVQLFRLPRKIKEIYIGVGVPDGYTRLEYIESNGEQYIDTEIPWDHYALVVEGEYSYVSLRGYSSIFGTQGDGGNLILREENGNLTWYATREKIPLCQIATNQKIKFNLMVNNNAKAGYQIALDGVSSASGIVSTEKVSDPRGSIYLFDTNYTVTGGPASSIEPTIACSARLYGFKIKMIQSGIVRDFIPAKNPEGIAGLYDFVSNKFYTSKSSKQFEAGPAMPYNSVARKVNTVYIGVNDIAQQTWKTE